MKFLIPLHYFIRDKCSQRNIPGSQLKYINFALKVDRGQLARLGLKTEANTYWIKNIQLQPGDLFHYYSFDLETLGIPEKVREDLVGLILVPSDIAGAVFDLDFISLDKRNLPGIQLKDEASPNGLSQLIPYEPEKDYIFFQIGDELVPEKGNYELTFKVKAGQVDPQWRNNVGERPKWRFYGYIEPKEAGPSDILYVSLETTRPTFFESPANLIIKGETFKESGRYYAFTMTFKADGQEKLYLQAFSPRHRRYPADLYITFPQVRKID